MTEPLFVKFQDGRQLIWDASSLDDAFKCLHYYQVRDLARWQPQKKATSASFGTLLHSCLETYDRALLASTRESHGDRVAEATEQALQEALVRGLELKESIDSARTKETLVRAVVWYAEQFKNDPYETATLPDGTAAVETRFELPFLDTGLRISGRIDRLVHYRGDLYVVDRKSTKKSLNISYLNEFTGAVQTYTYYWAAMQMGMKPRGLLYEHCQTMVSGCRWHRQTVELFPANITEYEADMTDLIRRVEIAHETGVWPRNRASCNNYGGCALREICNALPSQRHRYFTDLFAQVPYVPKP